MFAIKRGNLYKQGRLLYINFCQNYAPFLDLEFFVKFLSFEIAVEYIKTVHFLNWNMTRSLTYKIKCSYRRALAPACGVVVSDSDTLDF